MLNLKDPTLLKTDAYIGGEWVAPTNRYAVYNPANGEVVAEVADCGKAETAAAIDAGKDAQKKWAARPAKERAVILRKMYDLMVENQDDLATILTAEQGKPTAEAVGEIAFSATFFEYFGEEAKRIYGEIIPYPQTDRRLLVLHQPVGVTAGITPWNFPTAMVTRKSSAALAAGCSMVMKPARFTPLSALALGEIADRAGLPKGVFSVVPASKASAVGDELCENPTVRALSFTGSTEVGKMLLTKLAGTVKKAGMELGGNAPFIIFDDADIDQAVEGAMLSKFRNAGQTCICANRIFVQDGIYEKFMDKFRARVAALRVGPGAEAGVDVGPLIELAAREKVEAMVGGALSGGATASVGGSTHSLGRSFYNPTILENVNLEMQVVNDEIFGPVAPILRFKDEESVIEMANQTPYGLAAYFYARDIGRIWRVGEGLEFGIVGVNTGIISSEQAPFGGMKESGLGREGSKHGIDEWVEMKYLAMAGI